MGQPILISNLSKLKAESQTGNIEAQITYMFKRVYDWSGSADGYIMCSDLFEQHKIFEAMYYVWNVGFVLGESRHSLTNRKEEKEKSFDILISLAKTEKNPTILGFALNILGLHYMTDENGNRDESLGLSYYIKSAELGNEWASANLAKYYWSNEKFSQAILYYVQGSERYNQYSLEKLLDILKGQAIHVNKSNADLILGCLLKFNENTITNSIKPLLARKFVEWNMTYHRFWPNVSTSNQDITDKFRSKVLLLLLISKFRHTSSLYFIKCFCKGVAISVVQQLAWFYL